MGVPSVEPYTETHIDTYPLLMERAENHSRSDHIIDIRVDNASSSISCHDRPNNLDRLQNEERSSNSTAVPTAQPSVPSTNTVTTRTSSSGRRADSARRTSPLNSGFWISIHLVVTMSQIIASIVVLSVSKDEHPHAPLFVWIVGYASGCVATLPILYWRFRNRNQVSEQDSAPTRQNSAQVTAGPSPVSVTRGSERVDRPNSAESRRTAQDAAALNARLNALMEYFKMGLDCFFAAWFVVGNIWIFGGHASASEAPNMYRLCIVFLTFSCIGYAMPFILCATICCCLPCIISVLGFREDFSRTRGATTEAIDALPTYKFKLKKSRSGSSRDNSNAASDDGVGGVIAAGTARERTISAEDAVCCICLAKYGNNEELRELPCSHFFHKECVDKWLKINALCPLCKTEVNPSTEPAAAAANAPR